MAVGSDVTYCGSVQLAEPEFEPELGLAAEVDDGDEAMPDGWGAPV